MSLDFLLAADGAWFGDGLMFSCLKDTSCLHFLWGLCYRLKRTWAREMKYKMRKVEEKFLGSGT